MRIVLAILGIGFAGLLSACGSTKAAREANPAPCPNILVLNEAARAIEFDGEQKLEDVAYSAEITNVGLVCRYFEDRPITAEIEIDLAFGKGPRGDNGKKNFKYFVAVSRRNLEVIAKNEFSVPIDFSDKRAIVVTTEQIDDIVIPRKDENVSGSNFEIIVGLVVDREQVLFNRSGASLKFPELK